MLGSLAGGWEEEDPAVILVSFVGKADSPFLCNRLAGVPRKVDGSRCMLVLVQNLCGFGPIILGLEAGLPWCCDFLPVVPPPHTHR